MVAALLPSGRPLGFVAILGCLALLGMITKNAVILVGQIEAERAAGKSVFDAALDAGATRFRPIMLTALSTVFGMIPIAPTVFWGPMAFAIMGGLLAGTLLTLVFLPALYVAWFGDDRARAPVEAPAASLRLDVWEEEGREIFSEFGAAARRWRLRRPGLVGGGDGSASHIGEPPHR